MSKKESAWSKPFPGLERSRRTTLEPPQSQRPTRVEPPPRLTMAAPANAKPTLEIRFRDEKNSGLQGTMIIAQPEQGANLQLVQEKVIEKLQPHWTRKRVTLTRKNILVFCVSNGKTTLVGADLKPLALNEETGQQDDFGEEKKEEASTKDDIPTKFFALEYFTTPPIPLYCTVKPSQLKPATFTHPDHTSSFTRASPLYCAGFDFSKQEGAIPWCDVKDDQLNVYGVSLRGEDDTEVSVENNFDPFGPDGPDGSKGILKMTIEQYNEFVKEIYDPNFGVLRSNVTHNKRPVGQESMYICKSNSVKLASGGKKKRSIYFRFRLEKGVDLSAYGVAIVYDNSSKNHFSLVRLRDSVGKYRRWKEPSDLDLYLPVECFPKFDYVKNNEKKLNAFLTEDVFGPSGMGVVEPEVICNINDDPLVILPKVASFFTLHNLKLVASAEPVPPQGDFDTSEPFQLYNGALILYHLSDELDGWDVTSAIERLEKANYVLKDLDQSFCETLVENLDQQDYTTQLENLDESVCDALLGTPKDLEAGYEQAEWALDEMLEALRRRSEEDNVSPPPPPPTTVDHEKTPRTTPKSSDGLVKTPAVIVSTKSLVNM